MTDLKKALDCCGKFPVSDCGKCPYKGFTKNCGSLAAIAFNYINHREAEIERYKGVIKILENDVANAKYDAIHKLVMKLKDRVVSKYEYVQIGIFNELDDLVKEMTEAHK